MIVIRHDLKIGTNQLDLEPGAKLLGIDDIREVPRLWVAVPEAHAGTERFVVQVVLTGGEVPELATYIGSCVSRAGTEMHAWRL